ncbi:hypothetical protein NW766_003943 [Fusarium irregulare]|uniref:Amidase domain-containing protein n=1 Tax=Fusarium irregulare TaxID=2494466 RepID=A0A9W8UCT9_9HYPO|nr:hypothetical protein NW766_003943 [Fusarium irregulare]
MPSQPEPAQVTTTRLNGRGPALIEISRAECFHNGADDDDVRLLPSSVTVLPSGSFYSDYSELYPFTIDLPLGLFPTTVIALTKSVSEFSVQDLDNIIHQFDKDDDVWDHSFLAFVVLYHHGHGFVPRHWLSDELASRLRSLGTKRVALIDPSKLGPGILTQGPHFAMANGLLPVRKLFADTQAAFVASLVQSPSQTIRYLNATSADAYPNHAIAVPSRLYFSRTPEKPLNGLRVAIKDNIDVAGAKTFASSLAYGTFYGIKPESAPAIQKLIHLGAIIVGKTGMSQFADAEDPTGDFVDFHAPWNPRGDGLRSPGGSSYGSGAAAGAYDWIDFTIGTDTGGSVRQPAASQSVYGVRPSRGTLSIDGTVAIHRDLDAIGVLSRDLDVLSIVSHHLYKCETTEVNADDSLSAVNLTLIYPTHLFPAEDKEAQHLYDKTVTALEKVLNIERRSIDFSYEWEKFHPNSGQAFASYFQEVSPPRPTKTHSMMANTRQVFYEYVVWGQWQERSSFREEYLAKFERPPYVNPLSRFRWELGSNMTEKHFSKLRSKREEFQVFIEGIFGSNTIMVTPFKFGEPDRRDEYRPE